MKLSAFAMKEVEAALEQYRKEVEKTSLERKTKDTYLRHAGTFVRWLNGDFVPGANRK